MKRKLTLSLIVLSIILAFLYYLTFLKSTIEFLNLEDHLSDDFLSSHKHESSSDGSLVLNYNKDSLSITHYIFAQKAQQNLSTDFTPVLNNLLVNFPDVKNTNHLLRLTTFDNDLNYIDMVLSIEYIYTHEEPRVLINSYYRTIKQDALKPLQESSYLNIDELLLRIDSTDSGLTRLDYSPQYHEDSFERYDVISTSTITTWKCSRNNFYESSQWTKYASIEFAYDPINGSQFKSTITFGRSKSMIFSSNLNTNQTFQYSFDSLRMSQ